MVSGLFVVLAFVRAGGLVINSALGWKIFGVCILIGLVYLLGIFLGSQGASFREKMRPYECGFEPIGRARSPFSLRFFLLLMLFLLFDAEIVLIMPRVRVIFSGVFSVSGAVQVTGFLVVLLLALWYE